MTFQNYENFSSKAVSPGLRSIDFDKDGLIAASLNISYSVDLYKFRITDKGDLTLY
jgi:hypothetical protein